jgi:hypothetical protein
MKTTLLLLSGLFLSVASFAQTTVKNSEAIKHQTSVESNRSGSHVNSSADASSASSIHSNAVNKSKNQSRAEIKKEKKAIAAEKRAQAAEANAKGKLISGIASEKQDASTSADSKTEANAKGKLISGIASEKQDASTSADSKTEANAKGKLISGIASEKQNASTSTDSKTEANAKGKLISGIASEGRSNAADVKETHVAGSNVDGNTSLEIGTSGKQIKNRKNIDAAGNASVKSDNRVKARLHKKAIKSHKRIHATSSNVVEAAHAIHPKPVSIKTGTQVKANAGIKIK